MVTNRFTTAELKAANQATTVRENHPVMIFPLISQHVPKASWTPPKKGKHKDRKVAID